MPPGLLERLRAELTLQPRATSFVPSKPLQLMHETDHHVHVPRFYGLQRFGDAKLCDQLTYGTNLPHMRYEGSLRESLQQPAAVAAVAKNFDACLPRGAMLVLPCGYGKTEVALALIARQQRRTLVVAPTTLLVEQWVQRVALRMPQAACASLRGGGAPSASVCEADIVVTTVQSLALCEIDTALLSSFAMLVIDEAHTICAPAFSQSLGKVKAAYILALSATPERADGLHSSLAMLCGREVLRVSRPADKRVKILGLCVGFGNRLVRTTRVNGKESCNLAQMLNGLAQDTQRCNLLLQCVLIAAKAGRTVLILSDRVDLTTWLHCETEKQLGSICGYITGRVPMKKRARVVDASRVLFATTALAKLGLDKPELDTLIFATPVGGSSVEQPVGRILRNGNSMHRPLVIDVADQFSMFISLYRRRKEFYRSQSYDVQEHTLRALTDFDAAWIQVHSGACTATASVSGTEDRA